MRASCLLRCFGTPLRGEGLRPLLLVAGGEAGDIAGATVVARSWALFAHLYLAPRCATCPSLSFFSARQPNHSGPREPLGPINSPPAAPRLLGPARLSSAKAPSGSHLTPRPRSGGSPRKGARSELASGAATGGGGPQAPPTRISASLIWRACAEEIRSAPRPRSGGSPREGARSELASAAATGGGGPQAPPTRISASKARRACAQDLRRAPGALRTTGREV